MQNECDLRMTWNVPVHPLRQSGFQRNGAPLMTTPDPDLIELGWKSFFSDQLSPGERSQVQPVRVLAVHRGKLAVAGAGSDRLITPSLPEADAEEYQVAVGDWLLVDQGSWQISRILRRASLFKRRAPGSG